MLVLDLVGLERGQPPQRHLQDGLGLHQRELELLDQAVAGGLGVAGAADQCDHRVEIVQRDQQALEDVGAALLLGQLELGPADDDLALVAHVGVERLAQRQRARHAVDQRDHVDAEGRLHRRVLVELVEHDLGDGVALELDDQAHPALVGVVLDVGDPGELLLLHELGDLLDQAAVAELLDHVGQLGDDDCLLALLERLDVRARLEAHPAAVGGVGVADAVDAEDHAAGREVRPLHVAHQRVDVDVRVLDVGDHRVDRLAQVVRRDVRRHADRDARRAVDQQVREASRQDERLLGAPVVVGREVDRVHVEVTEHLHRHASEARLGVPHRGGRIVVDRTEVALAVDERLAHRPRLRHVHQRRVDHRLAVRVIVTAGIAANLRALPVLPINRIVSTLSRGSFCARRTGFSTLSEQVHPARF